MIISLDTETTGIDFRHSARPFLVTTCDLEGKIRFWEWDVDPLTREVQIPAVEYGDTEEITELIEYADLIYLQNAKFDAHALASIGIALPWEKVRDTLCMGHLLASNHPHDLTSMAVEYLGLDISRHEKKLEEIVKHCRNFVRRNLPDWIVAEDNTPGLPCGGNWRNDLWLPRALAWYLRSQGDEPDEEWWTVCSRYANGDSETTLLLGRKMEEIIRDRGLWDIYQHRLNLPRIAYSMECYGVTTIGEFTEKTIDDYEQYSAEAADELCCIASDYGHELQLAEGASLNDNMREFFYGSIQQYCPAPKCKYTKIVKHWNGEVVDTLAVCPKCAARKVKPGPQQVKLITTTRENLSLKVITGKKSGNASLDKNAIEEYLNTLQGEALRFVRLLTDKRRHDTDLMYMQAYRRFWLPIEGSPGYYKVHPSLNPFATDHLRWGSNNPNLQNVGKQESICQECDGEGCVWCHGTGKSRMSVRYCFGPAPGREWWSMDFQNIELRIPAYESGEEAMIELFEKPGEAPYFGSYHCLNASIIYPDIFWPLAEKDGAFKKKYKSEEYQWCKNGGFAIQYGCGERKADQTFHRKGAYKLLKEKLPKIAALNDRYVRQAERLGYVETIPDVTVDPKRGYPILASRTDDGRVLSTTPLNYHVSGTACWCKNMALIRCAAQLEEWRKEGFDAHLALEIHDELLFDFPKGSKPQENLERALVLKGLMEQSGDNLLPRIPTPITVEYHERTWAEGTVMK